MKDALGPLGVFDGASFTLEVRLRRKRRRKHGRPALGTTSSPSATTVPEKQTTRSEKRRGQKNAKRGLRLRGVTISARFSDTILERIVTGNAKFQDPKRRPKRRGQAPLPEQCNTYTRSKTVPSDVRNDGFDHTFRINATPTRARKPSQATSETTRPSSPSGAMQDLHEVKKVSINVRQTRAFAIVADRRLASDGTIFRITFY